MKKFLSLLLAAMMLLSCSVAFAAGFDTVIDGSATWLEGDDPSNEDADIDVSVATNYDSGENVFGKEGEAATEIWLQVDATGQIDVTVPLVLVFQTNIDGGDATSPSDYKITNHSTADLVVTQIATTKVAFDEDEQPMKMVRWDTTNMLEDTYAVQIKNIGGTQGTQGAATYDMHTDNSTTTVLYAGSAYTGGLFELEKAPANEAANGAGKDTALQVEMKTGRLSFVTSRVGEQADTMNAAKGIQLMTITYTVAIDTSDAYGEDITTEVNRTETGNILDTANGTDTAAHVLIVENTTSGATEGNTAD